MIQLKPRKLKVFKTKLRRVLLKAAIPISKLIGHIHMPFSRKLITGSDYFSAIKVLEPGMIFLTRTRGEFTNLFYPGFWRHAAIYLGDSIICEATGEGVHMTDAVTFFMSKDYIKIFKPTFCDDKEMERAANIAAGAVGMPYDFLFEANEAFYCAELVYFCYLEKGMKLFRKTQTLGELTYIPQNIADNAAAWTPLWSSESVAHEKL